uniref:Transposase-associated domain-containing protein n=1 Tax=Cucumis melo TaxID=3656 RepID=A0A9I9EC77_CUCME
MAQFLDVVKVHVDANGRIRCPCKRCMNSNWNSLKGVERHLQTIEIISPYYIEWVFIESRLALEVQKT